MTIRSACLWGALWLFAMPTAAHAWTVAEVRTVAASVRIDEQAEALVSLRIAIQVRGGWLEGFEVAGLEEEIVVLEDQPGERRLGVDVEERAEGEEAGGGIERAWNGHRGEAGGQAGRTKAAARAEECLREVGLEEIAQDEPYA